jgi:hypothetical protein
MTPLFPSDFDPLDDNWRWCVYCKADCWPDEPDHDEDCPSVTGRYPIDHPAEKPAPPSECCRCGHEFEKGRGEVYRLIRIAGDEDLDDHEYPTYESVCEDCAIRVELMGGPRL